MEKYPSLLLPSDLRHDLLEFHFHSSHQLQVPPVVKYTALSLFAERFLPILKRSGSGNKHWLVQPPTESNLQLFVLISIWVSSKIHGSRPLSVKSLKSLGDRIIRDQHFTTRDFAEAVLRFEIGASNICFVFLEDLLTHFRELSKFGELVSFDVCFEIMDLLYETEEATMLFASPCSLAASILVVAYTISVPKQQWEFPLLPWVKFVTSYEEESIKEIVEYILEHIMKPEAPYQKTTGTVLARWVYP